MFSPYSRGYLSLQDMGRKVRQVLWAGSLLVPLAILAGSAWAGPVILVGHDADDHGFENIYAGLFDNLLENVTSGQSGILSIGADPGSDAGDWIVQVANLMTIPQTVTLVNDADISTVDFSAFAILHIPSALDHTPGGISSGAQAGMSFLLRPCLKGSLKPEPIG